MTSSFYGIPLHCDETTTVKPQSEYTVTVVFLQLWQVRFLHQSETNTDTKTQMIKYKSTL